MGDLGSIHYTLDTKRKNNKKNEKHLPPIYDVNREFNINIRYYYKGKKLNMSSGVKCRIKNYNKDYHLNSKREPILKTDKDWRDKNKKIHTKTLEIQSIVMMLDKKGLEPNRENIKSQLREIQVERKIKSYKNVHLYVLFKEYSDWVNGNQFDNTESYKRTLNVSIRKIIEYIHHYESNHKFRLMMSDLDDDFMEKFVLWCSKDGLQPITIRKRCKTLVNFGNWCRDRKGIQHSIRIPKKLKSKVDRKPLYLNSDEVRKLWEFDEFNYDNPKHKEHLTYNSNEVEYIIDESVKKGREPNRFTNWEVYLDMMVFLCNSGMRYGDMVGLKWDNFEYMKDDEGKDIRNRGFLVFRMEKTNREVVLDVNQTLMDTMIKYIKNKTIDDYIFPRTKYGNSISNQVFNSHIKRICEKIGLNRRVRKPKFELSGKIMDGTNDSVPLHKLVSSHLGRKSYIKQQVVKGVPHEKIKSQTGHQSQQVFESYFSYDKEDLEGINHSMYSTDLSDGFQKGKSTPSPKEKSPITMEDLEFIEKMNKMVGNGLTQEEFDRIKRDRIGI